MSVKVKSHTSVTTNQQMLSRYLALKEPIETLYQLENKQVENGILIETYTLNSQYWPKPSFSRVSHYWQHTLIIYKPIKIKAKTALLFVNSGTRYPLPDGDNSLPNVLDFTRIAAETASLVIDLQDVPNQYLTLEDGIPRKGDRLVAHSWNLYMDDPNPEAYWPLDLPMTKAVVRALDAIQQIAEQYYQVNVASFVVAGMSKRGLSTWLTALTDARITAIAPVTIEILNTHKSMQHIFDCYDNWPQAFYDFIQEKIPERINSAAFERLMQIEDPLAYLQNDNNDLFKQRLSIPKYLICAAGDDFFVPDCLSLFLDDLPGETRIRAVPNQGHLIDLKIVEESLLAWYQTLVNNKPRPSIHWQRDNVGNSTMVMADHEPSAVTLWQAHNPNLRDFRLSSGIKYIPRKLEGELKAGKYHYLYQIDKATQGWQAHFVEMSFTQFSTEPLVFTTPMFVNSPYS